MAQFDVHRNRDAQTRELYPYLLDLQTDMLDRLATRIVAPLALATELGPPIKLLNPAFEVEGVAVVLSTQELAGVRLEVLGDVVTTLAPHRAEIIASLDFLFTGI